MKFFLFGFLFALILIAIGGGAYFIGQKQADNNNLETTPKAVATPAPTKSPTANISSQEEVLTPDQIKSRIIEAIEKKEFEKLSGLMESEVTVILHATECCGPMTKSEAVDQTKSYLAQAVSPWDFSDSNPINSAVKEAYPQNYNDIVGNSKNEYLIGIELSDDNKIQRIAMSVSYKLLIQ
ncbi:MAG TPA: hypothetical protein VIK81_04015 [Patescibacteria group bacterium]